jgi:hypothetical protein
VQAGVADLLAVVQERDAVQREIDHGHRVSAALAEHHVRPQHVVGQVVIVGVVDESCAPRALGTLLFPYLAQGRGGLTAREHRRGRIVPGETVVDVESFDLIGRSFSFG